MTSKPFSALASRKLYFLLIALDLGPDSEKLIEECAESKGATFIKVAQSSDLDTIGDNEVGNVNFVIIAHGCPDSDGGIFYSGTNSHMMRRDLLRCLESKFPETKSIGVYAGVCGGAIGAYCVGTDRICYAGRSFGLTNVPEVLEWVNILGLRLLA